MRIDDLPALFFDREVVVFADYLDVKGCVRVQFQHFILVALICNHCHIRARYNDVDPVEGQAQI